MMVKKSISIKFDLKAAVSIWRRNFLHFQKSWMLSVFWVFLEPISIFLAVGFGLGQFVSSVEGQTYSEFFFPGLLGSSAMMVSFLVCTYENLAKITHEQVYRNQLLAPLQASELYLGEILWSLTKSFLSFLALVPLGLIFHVIECSQIPLLLILYMLIAFTFSSFGMWVMSKTKDYEQLVYPLSGFVIPMSLFCGTYFPINKLPVFFQGISYALPLTHGVVLLRMALGSSSTTSTDSSVYLTLASLVVLLIFAGFFFELGRRAFVRRLSN